MLRQFLALAALCPALSLAAQEAHWPTLDGHAPLVIGHRGACGYRPEHTLASYLMAIRLGADIIEPDLVLTRDNVFVARHEPNIIATTDVAKHPEFADRKRKAVVDGVEQEGWFVSDFTLAELKTLHAIQARADRDHNYDGRFEIPTLQEIIHLAKTEGHRRGREVGLYPEMKHPTYHSLLGLPMEQKLADQLHHAGYTDRHCPVFIQCFEMGALKTIRKMTRLRLVQLIDADDVNPDGSLSMVLPSGQPYDLTAAGDKRTYLDLVTPKGLDEIATYADGIGPWKFYLQSSRTVDADGDGRPDDLNGDGVVNTGYLDREPMAPSPLVRAAHRRGLFVHAYTFRNEPVTRSYAYPSVLDEFKAYFALGVDGVFADFPDAALEARDH